MASIFDDVVGQDEGSENPKKRRSIFDDGPTESVRSAADEAVLAEKRAADRAAPTLGASYPKGRDRGYSPVFWKNSVDVAMGLPKPVPAAPGEIPTRGPYQSPGPTGGPAQPEAPEPTTLGRLIRGKGWLELGADVADIVVGGVPALVVGSYADLDQRMQALIKGQGWRAGGKAGAEASRQIGEAFGRPIYDNLVAAGLIDKGTRSIPMQAMDKVGSFLERSAETFEKDTGMPKEDYMSLVNGFMAAMGVKGTAAAVRHGVPGVKGLEARGKERAASAWDAALERFNAEEALARAAEAERQANRTTTPVKDARNARIFGQEQPQTDTRTVRQRRKDARDAFMSPEGEQLAASQVTYPDHHVPFVGPKKPPTLTPTGERTGSRDGVLLNLEGKETPTSQPGNQPFHTADTTAALKRGIVADTPIETEGRLASASRPSLDTAIEKVKGGRLFDLTPEERIALRGSREITDPKVITAAAVGATGLGLAMMYEPSPEEAAMAIGAGALLRRGGKGETLAELRARPAATPLGALLEASAYTTSTLEKLADASPGRFEFKKAQVEQLLKREGVTKHERDLMTKTLEATPGDTVTAKDLMVGLKVAAGDFELTPERSDSYANYGLNRIDRVDSFGAADNLELALDANEPTTRIYRSPLELGSNNHFGDPNYFAHTRSFVENGVRHVVELQSDLAQKAGKVLKPEERAALTEQKALFDRLALVSEEAHNTVSDVRSNVADYATALQKVVAAYDPEVQLDVKLRLGSAIEDACTAYDVTPDTWETWRQAGHYDKIFDDVLGAYVKAAKERRIDRSDLSLISSAVEWALRRETETLSVKRSEISAKLASAAPDRVSPMLKDWHKRLVREELADAARNLEGSVRFATADTVAKVEEWPFENDPRQAARYYQEEVAKLQEEIRAYTQLRDTGETGGHPYLDALRVADPESYARVREGASAELRSFEADLAEAQRKLKNAEAYAERPPKLQYPEHQGIYDRYQKDVEKFLRQLGGKPYTDSAGHTWIEVPLGEQQKALPGGGARTQMGGVDPALLKGIAAVGGTAALAWTLSSRDERARHAAAAAALTGLFLYTKSRSPAIADLARQFSDGLHGMTQSASVEGAVTPAMQRKLTNFELDLGVHGHRATKAIAPFVELLDSVPDNLRPAVDLAIMGGRPLEVQAALAKTGVKGLFDAWKQMRAEVERLGREGKAVGVLKELRPDYFPRFVKDLPGLLGAIGKKHASELELAIKRAERKAGGSLEPAEMTQVVNAYLEKHLREASGGGKPSFLKRRTIENVTVDLAPYYLDPVQTLPLYVGSMVRAIERAKFFGKSALKDAEGRFDLDNSVGKLVMQELEAGKITPENQLRLERILRARFGPGERGPHRLLRVAQQYTNIALLANAFSGAMNLADIGGIAAQQGILPAIKALEKKVRGKASYTAADVGLADAIAAEFVYGVKDPIKAKIPLTQRHVQISMSKAQDKLFKAAGFKWADTVMKETHLEAAAENYMRKARTDRGVAEITRRYGEYFGQDLPALLADLRAGKKTRLTTELAFRELSDAQPVTKIEMPLAYLENPNRRFMWALKSFMMKQLTLVKKRGVDELRKGNIREGTGFLVRYALLAGTAGASMDWIVKSLLGRDADLDWGDIPLNALKNFGLSQYVIDKMREGKGKEAAGSILIPPVDPVGNILRADPKAVSNFPLIGRAVYDHLMDGAEKANAAKKLAEKRKKRDAERTDEERALLRERAIERRRRLLEQP